MEEYVYIDGKNIEEDILQVHVQQVHLRCCIYVDYKNRINTINIDTPKGIPLLLKVDNINISDTFVECSIKKMVEMI